MIRASTSQLLSSFVVVLEIKVVVGEKLLLTIMMKPPPLLMLLGFGEDDNVGSTISDDRMKLI